MLPPESGRSEGRKSVAPNWAGIVLPSLVDVKSYMGAQAELEILKALMSSEFGANRYRKDVD